MKTLFFLILIAFFGSLQMKLKAQPTLTAANSNYIIGDQFVVANHNVGGYFILQPQVGANQIWDFSNSTTSKTDTIKVLSRAQAPFINSLPNANIVVYSNNLNYNNYSNFRYLEINNSKITERGKVYKGNTNVLLTPYLESPEIMRYPFTINSKFSDTAVSTYIGANNVTCTYKEIYTTEAVGFGQIITPITTYNQALQVRITRESLSDNCRPHMYKGYSNDVYYLWFVPNIHVPIFQIAEHTVSLGYYNSGYYLQSSILGKKEETLANINLQLSPNPATSELNIQYQASKTVKITLHDLVGKQVAKLHSGKGSVERQSLKVDLSQYPKGIYLLKLETDGQATTRKLILQ